MNFVCQRCYHPLQLDPSLKQVNEQFLQEISDTFLNCAESSELPELEIEGERNFTANSSNNFAPPISHHRSETFLSHNPSSDNDFFSTSTSSVSPSRSSRFFLRSDLPHISSGTFLMHPSGPLSPQKTQSVDGTIIDSDLSQVSRNLPASSIRSRFQRNDLSKGFMSSDDIPAAAAVNSRALAVSHLFELLGDATGISHPLCSECMQHAFATLERDLEDACQDAEAYEAHIKQLEETEFPDVEDLDKEIEEVS